MSADKHEPGPWVWKVNPTSKSVSLQSMGGERNEVLTTHRWGMSGAQIWFARDGIFRNIMEFFKPVPGREHHAKWHGTIDHPDARLIAAAPLLLEVLTTFLRDAHAFTGTFDEVARAKHAQALAAYKSATGEDFRP